MNRAWKRIDGFWDPIATAIEKAVARLIRAITLRRLGVLAFAGAVGWVCEADMKILPEKITDEERCALRGEYLSGHVADDVQCSHVEARAAWSADPRAYCRMLIGRAYAGRIFLGYRWFDDTLAKELRDRRTSLCDDDNSVERRCIDIEFTGEKPAYPSECEPL